MARQDPVATQRRLLLDLVRRAQDTRFGRDHAFTSIRSVADFQSRVPLRRYEAFWESYWEPAFPNLINCTWPGRIPFFALTSGTTSGVTKSIPYTAPMDRGNRRGAADIFVHHVANHSASRLMAGRNFMLGGSTDLRALASGVQAGDLSGIVAHTMPWWARLRAFPPRDLATLADWEEKVARVAPMSLQSDIRSIGGTPSWLLVFIDHVTKLRPGADRLVDLYPNLELLIHGGVDFAPYRRRFTRLLEGGPATTREVYAASEGFIAVADRGDGEGMRLLLDAGVFHEFVPVEELDAAQPTRHWVDDAEPGVEYALVVSTCAGAWGYVLGDTVRLTDRDPFRLLVTGRTSYALSAFGEHLIDAEIEAAVTEGATAIDGDVVDYSVGPLHSRDTGELGRHLFIVEFAEAVPSEVDIARFADCLDRSLRDANEDYAAHRAGGFGLDAPLIHVVPPGTFADWMKARGKLGGQHKVPRIINDADLLADLRRFTGADQQGP